MRTRRHRTPHELLQPTERVRGVLERQVRGLVLGVGAFEHQRVVRGVLPRVLAVPAAGLEQVGDRVVAGDIGHDLAQTVEPAHEQRVEHPLLAAQVVVDAHGRHAGGAGDASDGHRVGPLLDQELLGGIDDRPFDLGARRAALDALGDGGEVPGPCHDTHGRPLDIE